ncbi:MAG TPA: hypothetical protein VMH23_17550, partial [Bacteroidota bacterium]|nr:hypothetical protein [Bacteroidota bacterium]
TSPWPVILQSDPKFHRRTYLSDFDPSPQVPVLHHRPKVLFALMILFGSNLIAQAPPPMQSPPRYFFYNPLQTRGSDAAFSPLTLLLNGSFDALRIGNNGTRDLTIYHWRNDAQNIWNNISDPFSSIRAFGWHEFVHQEIFNLNFDNNDVQFIPNIADHTIGYGMQYAKITEWYGAHGYPVPVLWGVGTSLIYQYVNEMMQNGGGIYTNVDCVSDFDFFNILGYALFSFDDVKRFFSETVQLNDWSLQPLYVPHNHHLENTGQEFVLRYRLPFARQYAPFICWGVNSVVGLGYRYDNSNSISLGVGEAVTEMTIIHRGPYISSAPQLHTAVGLYFDNAGSLLTSLIVRGGSSTNMQLNVYPGLVSVLGVRPGCYLAIGGQEGFIFGVTFMGLPVSLGFER